MWDHVPVEHGVERRDFVYPHWLHFEQLRHVIHNADARPSLILPLAEVEEGNDSCLLVLGRVMRYDFIGAFEILGCELESNLEERVRQREKGKLYTMIPQGCCMACPCAATLTTG